MEIHHMSKTIDPGKWEAVIWYSYTPRTLDRLSKNREEEEEEENEQQ